MIRIKTTNSTLNVSDICVYQMVKNKKNNMKMQRLGSDNIR